MPQYEALYKVASLYLQRNYTAVQRNVLIAVETRQGLNVTAVAKEISHELTKPLSTVKYALAKFRQDELITVKVSSFGTTTVYLTDTGNALVRTMEETPNPTNSDLTIPKENWEIAVINGGNA